jgi:hypothetical protein
MTDVSEAFNAGLSATTTTQNPYYWSSACWEAFEVGVRVGTFHWRPQHGLRARMGRGSTVKVTFPDGQEHAYRLGYRGKHGASVETAAHTPFPPRG